MEEKKRKEATDERKTEKGGRFSTRARKTGERIRLKRGAKRKNREGGFG